MPICGRAAPLVAFVALFKSRPAHQQQTRESPVQESGNILVIEDSKFFSQIVCKAVSDRTGLNAVPALSFAEARAAIQSTDAPFDLALCDIVLPDSENGETVEYLCEQNIPTVVFTGLLSEDLRDHLLSKNIIDYVVKDTPASLEYLVNLVSRLQHNKGTKILVVDDSRVSRRYVRELLELYRFDVLEAGSGEEALDALDNDPNIRMMITDYNMPDMDGVELTRRARSTHGTEDLSIMGFSAVGGNVVSAHFLKNGANDYIIKPFLREEFLWRVTQNIQSIEMIRRLKSAATTDALTGMHNRRFFFDAGATMLASAKRGQLDLTLVMLDIDYFKKVNDTYGHEAGDEVLKKIADCLNQECRQTDVVARLGGEEFAILAVNLDQDHAAAFIEKLRQAVEDLQITHEGTRIPVTASFGVCQTAGDSVEAMLRVADELLYEAKKNGRNRAEFDHRLAA